VFVTGVRSCVPAVASVDVSAAVSVAVLALVSVSAQTT